MKAGLYIGEKNCVVRDVSNTAPKADEVQINVAYTGLCGTDLHIFHGDMDARVSLPAIIGHEMSGTIQTVGDEVSGWHSGDTVTVMPLKWCGTCSACLSGYSHICERLNFVGIDSPGSLQEHWNVPASLLVRVPEGLSLHDAALAEPSAVAVHDVRRAALQIGEKAIVIGGGPIGVLVALVARAAGADVMISEVDSFRREVATSLGIATVDPREVDIGTFASEWTGGGGANIAFEVSGTQPGIEAALAAVAVRGRVVVVGIHPVAREVSLHRVFWRELSIVGARVYQRQDFEVALRLLADGVIPAEKLISRVMPLSGIADAFSALESGGQVMKVLLDCQGG